MKKLLTFLSLSALLSVNVAAQNATTTFATWKNNATGAYTIVHDDYGSGNVNGIENYADTIAYNRGVKFTFGAITSVVTPALWTRAKELMSHGHELANHSQFHRSELGWSDTKWVSFDQELKQSTRQIYENTGYYPRFFIWPYDEFSNESKAYLRDTLSFWGGRGGDRNGALNDNINSNFFNLNFHVFYPTSVAAELNTLVNTAITQKKWAIRELHGVQDGSWGVVAEADYRAHCNHIRSKVSSGELWNATALEVISYLKQTQGYQPVTTTTTDQINIAFNKLLLDTAALTSSVTMNVVLPSTDFKYVYQGNKLLSYTQNGNTMSFNCYPHRGGISIYKTNDIQYRPEYFTQSLASVCKGQKNIVYEVPKETGVEYVWSVTGTGVSFTTNDNKLVVNFGTNFTSATISVQGKVGSYISMPLTMYVQSAGTLDYTVQDTTVCPGSLTLTAKPASLNYEWFSDRGGQNQISTPQNILNAQISSDSTFYLRRASTVVEHQVLTTPVVGTSVYGEFARLVISKTVSFKQIKSRVYTSNPQTVKIVLLNSTGKVVVKSLEQTISPGTIILNHTLDWQIEPGTYYLGIIGSSYIDAAKVPLNTSNSGLTGVYAFTGSFYINNPGLTSAVVDAYNSSHHGVCYDIVMTEGNVDQCPLSPVKVTVNTLSAVTPVFVDAPSKVTASTPALFSVQTRIGETYTWSSSPANDVSVDVTGNGAAYFTFGETLDEVTVSVSASTGCSIKTSTHDVEIEKLHTGYEEMVLKNKQYNIATDHNWLGIVTKEPLNVTIFTASGKQIYSTTINSQQGLSLASGLYLVHLENGEKSFNEKVIVP